MAQSQQEHSPKRALQNLADRLFNGNLLEALQCLASDAFKKAVQQIIERQKTSVDIYMTYDNGVVLFSLEPDPHGRSKKITVGPNSLIDEL